MNPDETTATAVGWRRWDSQELRRIQAMVKHLLQSPRTPPRARQLARETAADIEGLISTGGGPCRPGPELVKKVCAVQALAGESMAPVPGPAVSTRYDPGADPQLLAEFCAESLERIQEAETSLLALETTPGDQHSVNAVFRAFHTIKSTSGFLGLAQMQRLAHEAEALAERVRAGEVRLTGGYADLAFEACDAMKAWTEALVEALQTRQPARPLALPDVSEELIGRLSDPEAAGITDRCSELDPAVPRIGDILVTEGKVSRRQVEAVVRDQGRAPLGEALVRLGAASAPDVARALRSQEAVTRTRAADGTVRVRADKLDQLGRVVDRFASACEAIRAAAGAAGGRDAALARHLSELDGVAGQMREVCNSMRMVPLRTTFRRMTRLVRDMARRSGKSVTLVTEGQDVEIDRDALEQLHSALVHAVRNAVDHGIEAPAERRACGKAETGTVVLRARQSRGSVVIELQDDGRGLDGGEILRDAVEKGLVPADRRMAEHEVLDLIFAPGVSTSNEVTDVSGRGVGLDVVRCNVESLGGRVDVTSLKGQGTILTIRLPRAPSS